MTDAGYLDFYRGRRVMITGGLGFIGSNLARRLVDLGADVLLVDSLIPDYGGNLFNIDGLADRVTVLHQGQVIVEGAADQVQNDPQVQEVYFGQR